MNMFAWAICNVAAVACFTTLAVHFEKWWIALFAIFFVFNYSNKERQ